MMSIKEGACWDEHWVLYVSDGSLNPTPEDIIMTWILTDLDLNLKKKKYDSVTNTDHISNLKMGQWGAWMAQSVKRPTSARSRSRGPWVRAPRRALG